jgi:hypothetical protein
MQWLGLTVVIALVCTAAAGADKKKFAAAFDRNSLGKVPPGWTVAKTGKGEGSTWKVVADETAPSKSGVALAQVAESPSAVFNLCVADASRFQNVDVSVAFKAIKGKNDQGGGIVWRYQDNDNYYICRMNPLENNYRLYKVVAGKRIQLATKENLSAKANEWHRLKVEMDGDQIRCYLDGEKMLEGKDDTFKTAGKIGLWSKADAQTHFDEFQARER